MHYLIGYLRMFIPAILLMCLAPISCTLDPFPSWWSRALTYLPSVCVVNNTCHNYSTERLDSDYNAYSNNGWTPCCTECSCQQDCHLEGNCCFPSSREYPDRRRQDCRYTHHITYSRHSLKSFYMYIECDPDLNVNDMPTIDQTNILPLQPVYSKRTGKIYCNKTIAQCNGITDGIEWTYLAACSEGALHFVDMVTSFNSCRWWFEYPGNASDLRTEECFEEVRRECQPAFRVPQGLNMTTEEVLDACTHSGFVSPFRPHVTIYRQNLLYSNVFCYICNRPQFDYDDGMCPLHVSEAGGKTSLAFSFVLRFDTFYPTATEHSMTGNKKRLACFQLNGTSIQDCRPISCPSGQQILATGNCDFAMERISIVRTQLYLKLDVVGSQLGGSDLYTTFDNLTPVDHPWPEDRWKLVHVYCEAKENSSTTNICARNYLVVILECEEINVDPRLFFDDIKKRLNSDWLWSANGQMIRYTQTLHRHPIFTRYDTNDIYMSEKINKDKRNLVSAEIFYIMKVHTQAKTTVKPNTSRLTKMFFCDQVTLEPQEYEIRYDFKLLLYKPINATLYFGEFVTFNGKVKICLSDSVLWVNDLVNVSVPSNMSMITDWYGRCIMIAVCFVMKWSAYMS